MFSDFLLNLRRKGIQISYERGKIQYSGPEENINEQLIEDLKKYKGKLIRHLWPIDCVNMMPINTEGKKIPFVLLHGEKMNYPLSEYFGSEQPFYGFFHYGSEGEKIYHRTVESFAKDYIAQLQRIIPEGPYFLGGFSFGGFVAFEMATQLQKSGFEVPVLILIDCKIPRFKEPIIASNIFISGFYKFYFFSKYVYRLLYHKSRRIYFEILIFFKRKLQIRSRNYYISGTYRDISQNYNPQEVYQGEILLFRSTQNNSAHKYLGWDALCRNVNIVMIEGDHKTIYESQESYKSLGKHIGDYLQKSNEERKSAGKELK